MFHFSQYYFGGELVDEKDSPDTRVDVCSGFFKHINPTLVDQVVCVVVDVDNNVLVLSEEEQNITPNKMLPNVTVISGLSPKQAILNQSNIRSPNILGKSLNHLMYQKTLKAVEGELDQKGNQLWEVESSQVVFIVLGIQHTKDNMNQNQSETWLAVSELSGAVNTLFNSQRTLGLLVNILSGI